MITTGDFSVIILIFWAISSWSRHGSSFPQKKMLALQVQWHQLQAGDFMQDTLCPSFLNKLASLSLFPEIMYSSQIADKYS